MTESQDPREMIRQLLACAGLPDEPENPINEEELREYDDSMSDGIIRGGLIGLPR